MRPVFAALLLAGAALALPAAEKVAIDDCCCCCDISKNAISCTDGIPPDQCVCPAVVCPANARTIFPGVPFVPIATAAPQAPAPVPVPAPVSPPVAAPANPATSLASPWWLDLLNLFKPPQNDCCCCNALFGVITCQKQPGLCICPVATCPLGAPTIRLDNIIPQQTPRPSQQLAPLLFPGLQSILPLGQQPTLPAQSLLPPVPTPTLATEPCCCCDVANQQITCELRAQDDCICTLGFCPAGVPTVWPNGDAPDPTIGPAIDALPGPTVEPPADALEPVIESVPLLPVGLPDIAPVPILGPPE
ncbi:hypothetical protein HJFPF1_02788 [Paramyrothecium foliicola]|nr:hypothetical protein HJFPF1_02788 [Paramyrothecium foliicola]